MKIRVMCAVPHRGVLDVGPQCVDGRGGQIYHNATPGFIVKNPSDFQVAVAVSFLLEYGPDEKEVSHLAYVVGSASMDGTIIGTTQNDFVLNPHAPTKVSSRSCRLATYENIPLEIRCSSNNDGLIELSWALKIDTFAEPVESCDSVHVRSWNSLDLAPPISSRAFDQWLIEQSSKRLKEAPSR
jgi:hypothetical protein